MERLTKHYGSYIAVKGTKSLYPGHERKTSPLSNCIVRLAAYEDLFERLGLDITDPAQVEELTALVKARDEGRVVVLPCKVGDVLYTASPVKGMVTSFEAPDLSWIVENIPQFGKTVFITRAEAEAAQREEGQGG